LAMMPCAIERESFMVAEAENGPVFPENLRGKRIVVLGAGRSGRAASALLARLDAQVVLADDNPDSVHPDDLDDVVASRVQLFLGPDVGPALLDRADGVVASPGIRLDHPVLARAREKGIPVIGELDLGARAARAPLVAVTGTNGKTTTVHWIAHILAKARLRAILCGNVGTALCRVVAEKPDWFVVEVSSFQLETVERFRPRVAAILNIAPDHLDRHPTARDYLATKARITANQQGDDALVLNADDAAVWSVGSATEALVWGFSLKGEVGRGVFLAGSRIVARKAPGEAPRAIASAEEIALPGRHNLANALAAAAAALLCGVEIEQVAEGLRDFRGVEHRLERVRERRGVLYVNDSKATNPASLEVALRSFERPIVLIAGGRGKGVAYEELAPLISSRVRRLILLGEEAPRMKAAWGGLVPTFFAADMEEAVAEAARSAEPGDVVLLSPACASFDMYRNYEERGRHFKRIVLELG